METDKNKKYCEYDYCVEVSFGLCHFQSKINNAARDICIDKKTQTITHHTGLAPQAYWTFVVMVTVVNAWLKYWNSHSLVRFRHQNYLVLFKKRLWFGLI